MRQLFCNHFCNALSPHAHSSDAPCVSNIYLNAQLPKNTLICQHYLQILLPSSDDPLPEYRAFDLHVHFVEGIHDSLDPILVDLCKEILDGLLGSGTSGVRGDGGR